MPGKLLHVPERAACLDYLLGAASDKGSAAAMAGCALEAECFVEPVKPDLNGARRHADVAFAVNDAVGGLGIVARSLEGD